MIHSPNWARKKAAREDSVINRYRTATGNVHIPPCRDYWTFAGMMEELEDGHEPVQMIESGLIDPYQYHGVEIIKERYEISERSIHARYPKAHIHYGDMIKVMEDHICTNSFHPEIVYLDSMWEPEKAFAFFAKLLRLINMTSGYTMAVCNSIYYNPRSKKNWNWLEYINTFERNSGLQFYLEEGNWKVLGGPNKWPTIYKISQACLIAVSFAKEGPAHNVFRPNRQTNRNYKETETSRSSPQYP